MVRSGHSSPSVPLLLRSQFRLPLSGLPLFPSLASCLYAMQRQLETPICTYAIDPVWNMAECVRMSVLVRACMRARTQKRERVCVDTLRCARTRAHVCVLALCACMRAHLCLLACTGVQVCVSGKHTCAKARIRVRAGVNICRQMCANLICPSWLPVDCATLWKIGKRLGQGHELPLHDL